MKSIKNARGGLSLVEIMMATLILSVITLAAVESMASVAAFSEQEERTFDLSREAETIIAEVSSDLSRSGWEFPSFDDNEYTGISSANDREKVYYPYVLQQSPVFIAASRTFGSMVHPNPEIGSVPSLGEGLPAEWSVMSDPSWLAIAPLPSFGHCRRDAELVRIWDAGEEPLALPGHPRDFYQHFESLAISDTEKNFRYYNSFYARSQELVFLRSAVSEWEQDPEAQQFQLVDFSGDDDDWKTVDPDVVEAWIVDRDINYYRTNGSVNSAGHSGPFDGQVARRYAEQDAREHFFRHEEVGVLRMDEFGLNLQPVGSPPTSFVIQPFSRPSAPVGKQFIDPIVSPGAWLAVDPSFQIALETRWETKFPRSNIEVQEDVGKINKRMNPNHLREYMYAVVPSPFGDGRLVRAYSVNLLDGDGDGANDSLYSSLKKGVEVGDLISFSSGVSPQHGFVIDKVLSDKVARVCFDTVRSTSEGDLGLNEVRLRLYMVSQSQRQKSARLTYIADHVITMRTGNNAESNAKASAKLVDPVPLSR